MEIQFSQGEEKVTCHLKCCEFLRVDQEFRGYNDIIKKCPCKASKIILCCFLKTTGTLYCSVSSSSKSYVTPLTFIQACITNWRGEILE